MWKNNYRDEDNDHIIDKERFIRKKNINIYIYSSDGIGTHTQYRMSVVAGVFIGIGTFLSHFQIPKFDKITV